MHNAHQKSVALGAIFLLVLCGNVGQAQLVPIFDWVMSFFGSYEEPPYSVVRNISDVSLLQSIIGADCIKTLFFKETFNLIAEHRGTTIRCPKVGMHRRIS